MNCLESNRRLVMQAMFTSVILAFLCVSSAYTISSHSPKITTPNLITKVQQSAVKGTECGKSASAPNLGRIVVGGEEARPHSWPWQVFIQCVFVDRFGKPYVYFCGGSIISDMWIVTAAHCVKKANYNMTGNCKVLLGKHSLESNESTELVSTTVDYFVHTEYDPVKSYNGYDLALCKLAKRLQFTDAIKPICLPFGLPELPPNKSCYATGWGRTKHDLQIRSDRLQQLSLTVQEDLYCGNQHRVGRIICAGQKNSGKDVCRGDSGGPLACQEENSRWYLRGVTSQGPRKCNGGSTFTKITAFEEWIKNITARTECGKSAIAPNQGRIVVGGEEARPHAWPWQVYIQCQFVDRFGKSFEDSCGGSIISDMWIITAAHCLKKANYNMTGNCKVLLGKHNLKSNESTELVATTVDYFVHSTYDPVRIYNGYDLALCKLAKRLQFTDAIKPICLPFGLPQLPYNKTCYATGWGRTERSLPIPSDRLRQLSMTVQEDLYCRNIQRAVGRIICAGQWNSGKDVCKGDSGGPLACLEENRTWYLRGVTSYGPFNCNGVAIFTKITAFEEWIQNITAHN